MVWYLSSELGRLFILSVARDLDGSRTCENQSDQNARRVINNPPSAAVVPAILSCGLDARRAQVMERLCVTHHLVGQPGWPNGALTTMGSWRRLRSRWEQLLFLSCALRRGRVCCIGGASFGHGGQLQWEESLVAVKLLIYVAHEGIANPQKCLCKISATKSCRLVCPLDWVYMSSHLGCVGSAPVPVSGS